MTATLNDQMKALDGPFTVVTTRQVDDVANTIRANATNPAEADVLLAMLGVDAVGRAEGVARGQWTQVAS